VIHTSTVSAVKDTLIATGFPYYDFNLLNSYMETLKHLFIHTHGVRRIGSAATDLAYVACGRFDAFYEYGLNPWDVAAGFFILQQAGGKTTDFKGGVDYIFGKELIATNKLVHDEFMKVIKQYFL